MLLYIVRHGETDWNKAGKVQGRTDIPLNERGRYLAEATAEGMKDVRIDFCYTSPLIRAKETAQIILGEREIPLVEEKRIEEICFGKCEGAKRFSAFLQIRKTMFLLKEQSRSVNYMKEQAAFCRKLQIGRI